MSQLTVQAEMNEEMKKGHKMIRTNHRTGMGRDVKLAGIPVEWLEELHDSVELMSMHDHHERALVFMYIEEMIQLLPEVKAEGFMEKGVFSVLETLLQTIDYLTHENKLDMPFNDNMADTITAMLAEVFEAEKSTSFSADANRPVHNKSGITEKEGVLFAEDKREVQDLVYVAVLYKKPKNHMERMKQLSHWLVEVQLKPNTNKVSYEDMLEGKTDHGIHERTLFYLNMVIRTLSWFMNSTSWRSNELQGFDKMEIASKLGIYR